MAKDASVNILLELIDKASPELEKFKNSFQKTGDEVSASSKEMGSATEGAAETMGGALTTCCPNRRSNSSSCSIRSGI